MLNIVIPMAGRGSRFRDAGYTIPKPFIKIHGTPMIELVIENVRPQQEHKFIFICLSEHLAYLDTDAEIVTVDSVTEGAACTMLLTRDLIDKDDPLMIVNSDQWFDLDINDFLDAASDWDGLIMTMLANDPKWSYARVEEDRVVEVVEKQVVSQEATVGVYYFSKGSDFVQAADMMIAKDLRVNGEFYIAPTYNQLIAEDRKIGYFNIGKVGKEMYGLGTPEDLKIFLNRN